MAGPHPAMGLILVGIFAGRLPGTGVHWICIVLHFPFGQLFWWWIPANADLD